MMSRRFKFGTVSRERYNSRTIQTRIDDHSIQYVLLSQGLSNVYAMALHICSADLESEVVRS